MEINDKFNWGHYKNLTLKQVYQGTSEINRALLGEFMNSCWNDDSIPKFIEFEFIDFFMILEEEIIVVPQIFNEDKPKRLDNLMNFGDLSEKLSSYFNFYLTKNSLGSPLNFKKFNHENFQYMIGGDPEYLEFCIKKINNFYIEESTKLELQSLEVNKFLGIKIIRQNKNSYSYEPIIQKQMFKFKK